MRFNYKIESYNKCEHCKYFIQHYNINYNFIYKVNCGHCGKYDKDINPHKSKCPYFEQINKQQVLLDTNKDIFDILNKMELSLAYIKTYLNKDTNNYQIDDILVNKLNR